METKRWAPPARPLLLELLALVFVILAIAIPAYLQHVNAASVPSQDVVSAQVHNLQTSNSLFWGIGILGLYLVHLYLANESNDRISTSVTHFLAPVAFAMITYYRLFSLKESTLDVVSGSPFEIAKWAVGVFAITLLLARLRMAGQMRKFADVQWDLDTNAQYDASYFQIMMFMYPLLYPPRCYHVCPQGLLIEGWFYIMPIPFDVIRSVEVINYSGTGSSGGLFLASSGKKLVRFQTNDDPKPVYISPADRDGFVKYCTQHIGRLTPAIRKNLA
ncbi:MAG: hypothetical protein AB7T27_02180 [Kiritimatiellia bacterium]